jgi:hypothetical protein
MSSTKSATPLTQLWQSRVDAWQQSGLSVRQFCEEHQLAVASFYQWRRKLSASLPVTAARDGSDSSPFIQLPTAHAQQPALPAGDGSWQIVLALGNGIELRLRRGLA